MISSLAGKDPLVGAFTEIFIVALATLNVSARLLCAKCISSPFFKGTKSILKDSYYLARENTNVYFHYNEVLLYTFFDVLD